MIMFSIMQGAAKAKAAALSKALSKRKATAAAN